MKGKEYFNFAKVILLQNKYLFLEKFITYELLGLFIQFINQGFKCFGWTFFILKFHCFMLLLNFITSKCSFLKRIDYLSLVTLSPDMLSSCSVSLKTFLLIYWSSFWKIFSFLLSLSSIFNNSSHYVFHKIFDLSGNSWSVALCLVF